MSNVVQLTTEDALVDEAILWITRIDRGLSQTEKRAFLDWLAQSEQNQQIFIEHAKLWDKMDSLSVLSELVPKPETKRETHWLSKVAAVAATILVSVGIWHSNLVDELQDNPAQIIVQQSFATGFGEQTTFYMQDKTKVVLNTNSKLTVTYTDAQRFFHLEQGEIHVDVAHDANWPLSVQAGNQKIQAVGTAFNVEIKGSTVELIVTDGKVLVQETLATESAVLAVENIILPPTSLAVEEGQKVDLGGEMDRLIEMTDADLTATLSWQDGELIFRGETLQDAMREVSRYTEYQFEFKDEAIKSLKVAGLYKTDDLDLLLSALEQNLLVQHQRTSANTIQLSLIQVDDQQ